MQFLTIVQNLHFILFFLQGFESKNRTEQIRDQFLHLIEKKWSLIPENRNIKNFFWLIEIMNYFEA